MTCAQYSRAMAYLSRHQLDFKWKRVDGYEHCVVGYQMDRAVMHRIYGIGTDLYEAVLDYQEKSGIGWNS